MTGSSSTIIEDLLGHYSSDPSIAVAFFYFDFNNEDTTLGVVLRSLIQQLTMQSTTTPHALETLFKNASPHRMVAYEQLMSTLKAIIASFQAVYIVFDALDECLDRRRFFKAIRDIHDSELDTLHLLATSRKEQYIKNMLDGLISHEMAMKEGLVDSDILVHVTRTLEDDAMFSMYSPEVKEMVKTTLTRGAFGM
jgi:hypothetical protein